MRSSDTTQGSAPPEVEVVIEIPRWSFLNRGSTGRVDFISPLPCPYNYGSIHNYIGGEGDYLDAIVLGPRLPLGAVVTLRAWGSVGMSERNMYDDKLICATNPVSASQRARILRFFHAYARCKGLLNRVRGFRGDARCEGWDEASAAIDRAVQVTGPVQRRPSIGF
jgi:inorganic pyrophosphatase